MTQALPSRTDLTPAADLDPASVRVLRELQLVGLLEDVATVAAGRYGVTQLVVDRGQEPDAAHITAVVGDLTGTADVRYVDLWELDPMLWDDANWAAVRLFPFGDFSVVRPRA